MTKFLVFFLFAFSAVLGRSIGKNDVIVNIGLMTSPDYFWGHH
jgi:hypothetical protein